MKTRVHIKRAYDPADSTDGYRVFVDRLWPRGLSKKTFTFDAWEKELAPSTGLRTWFGHKAERWDEFGERYRAELHAPKQQQRLHELLAGAGKKPITLVYGAKDTEHNQAVIIAGELSRIEASSDKQA